MMARVLLLLPAALLGLGGAMHLSAFKKAAAAVAGSTLPPFFGNALKALWVMDSCGMFVVAAVCVALALRPESASPLIAGLVALIPLSTALLLYLFIGNFFAAHMLLAASLSMLAAAAAM
jgi:hypothetical protein